jgi:hypothetical protein
MITPNNNGMVGIFWLVGKRLIIDTAPLCEAGNYGEFKIYEGDHVTLWAELEKRGEVPRGSAFEEHPHGRVNFNTRTKRFTLFADPCILRKKNVVRKLVSLMRLPEDTALSTDEHYRCFRCLRRRRP